MKKMLPKAQLRLCTFTGLKVLETIHDGQMVSHKSRQSSPASVGSHRLPQSV